MKYAYYKTQIGLIEIAHQDKIYAISLVSSRKNKNFTNDLTDLAYKEITAYLRGEPYKFTFYDYLEIRGTDFQKSVLKALRDIPYGKTLSYKDIAQKIGNPGAVRAVGSAVGKNPFLIVYPCHRVIKNDGRIGSFAYGQDLKKYLLDLEGASYKSS